MTHNSFKKANKSAVYLKLAITGPSGSGKTTAALRLARGLVGDNGRIAVIDTENSSSLLYADTFDFDVCVVEPPYTEDKFITAIADAVEGKYDCVIIDSFSHVWQAILDYKSKLDMRGGNSYTNWAAAGGKFESILQTVLSSKLHIICCMRSKMDYAIDIDEKGKKSIRKVGLAPNYARRNRVRILAGVRFGYEPQSGGVKRQNANVRRQYFGNNRRDGQNAKLLEVRKCEKFYPARSGCGS